MPGYTYLFVDNVPKQCICPICKLPMQSPVTLTSCQHTFCDSCLRPRLGNGRSSLDLDSSLMCPLDEQMVDQRNVHASVGLRDTIEGCMVRCPMEPQGCRWVDIVRHVPSHMESCRYVAVPCPENCGDMICRVFLRDHVSHACPRRRRECPFCRCSLAAEDYQKHEGSCPEEPVWCENKCGQRMPRRRLSRHMGADCAKREVSCSFCRRRFLFDTLQVHVQQCTLKGSGTASTVAHNPLPVPGHHQFSVSTSTSNSSSTEATAANGKAATPDATIDRGLQSQQHPRQSLSPPPVPRRAASAECLDGVGGGGGVRVGSDCPLKWCGCLFKGDRAAVDRHAKEAAAHHVTLLGELARAQRRELDTLRRQLRHLPLVHNGHLVWRIDSYREKLTESAANRELEFCSVPFYTCRPGYRLQASVFLNGNGAATGRYLSLYAKLLPGEFDPILDWPFAQPIRMRLLDQSEGRQHLEESFTPDPTWRHFRRPSAAAVRDREAAFGFGFPRFASHELLQPTEAATESRRFVLDNVAFLEIEVLPLAGN